MAIQARSYRDEDLARLQATLALWVREAGECGYYHPGNIAHRIYEGLTSRWPRQELIQVWEEGTEIVGFLYNYVFDTAFFVFTQPKYRGTDVERQMLQTAYATTLRFMREAGREELTVITDVYDCDQIRIDLLTELGFEYHRMWDYITKRSLADPIPDASVPDGFTIRSATMNDAEQLAAVRNSAFNGSWTADVYYQQVMHSPGYQSEREIVVVAPDGRFAAFTVIRFDSVNKVGIFEPVGTHSDFRRIGLGRAMLLHAMQEMQRHGMGWASVEHTADNVPARELYRNVGFVKQYETIGFQRLLGEDDE